MQPPSYFGGKKYKEKVDTNVFNIELKVLKDQSELATGDPVFCKECDAIFNKHSLIEENKD
jgi:hypothetical protein